MRLRWTIIPALFVVAIVAIYNVCHQTGGPIDTIVVMARRITFGALFAVGFCSASFVLQKWMSQPIRPAIPPGTPAPPLPAYAMASVPTGPGQYRVRGVDRESHFETAEVVYADSPSNAQLKVELKGVQVTAVERAG